MGQLDGPRCRVNSAAGTLRRLSRHGLGFRGLGFRVYPSG